MILPGITELVNGGTGKAVIPESVFLTALLPKFFVKDICQGKTVVHYYLVRRQGKHVLAKVCDVLSRSVVSSNS